MKKYIRRQDEVKQVSTTGARALLVLIALAEGPKSFNEIRDFLVECGIADRTISIDTIRIDIRTLKAIGCEITRATKKTDNKHVLASHPFTLVVNDTEIKALKEIYLKIAKYCSPQKLLEYHYLLERIASMIKSEKYAESVRGISLLKAVDIKLLENLVNNERTHNIIKIKYQPPNQKEREYDITLEKLGLRNNKLYVYCYNHTTQKRSFLNVARIKEIICNIFDKNSPRGLDIYVKFKLNSYNEYFLEENETIEEEHGDYAIITGRYFNEFIAVQRMLYFCPDCVILEPENIKIKVLNKLKEMRDIYG
ncbi:MAG: WYL domain-containing protein [Candidatus Gastranaerophilales bacterium]|nr:WYL domain-containing protein [Candidatus Gastranaerophilales bacterium]